ncbi:MBL fold metallo-hydrolase [Marinobacter sp.]|uniref:MBL fold metallo-hydrolase n=1 Tax=Marinobacter sp. TaxID=50741 RepID=UPI001B4A2781|nr:MBL fold metallo-hydrolase [Marinobacter sp.]MBQ0833135.1 MBL fold metallo-hydrolase [Marinobacter sp.]
MIHIIDASKILLSLASTALLATSQVVIGASPSPFPDISIPFSAHSLGVKNIFYFRGESGVPDQKNEGFTSNAGFVVTIQGVIVFDALGTPSLGAAMVNEIRKITDQPITHIVVSHYHADHIYGLQALKVLTGAEVIAQKSTHLYTDGRDSEKRLKQRQQALAPWVDKTTRVVPPDLAFKDEIILHSGNDRFSIYHAGPAHAPGDSMMMVEPAGVLFAGDIIQSGRVPFLNSPQVDTENWMSAIEKVKKLNPVVLIPGHGKASENAMEALNFTYDYLAFVRNKMKAAADNWISFEDAYRQVDWSRYEELPAFDASNKGNAYRVFLDMEQKALVSE